jgi:hypothetical protein
MRPPPALNRTYEVLKPGAGGRRGVQWRPLNRTYEVLKHDTTETFAFALVL